MEIVVPLVADIASFRFLEEESGELIPLSIYETVKICHISPLPREIYELYLASSWEVYYGSINIILA